MRISDWSSDVCSSDLLPFGEPGIAVHAGIGQQFGQEAAFGPGWNDDGVLHALRLHQSQYLGTEIVTPVGPAQTTPRHCAGPQVNTLDTWGIDPDFPPGQRCGQARHLCAVQLECQRFNSRWCEEIGRSEEHTSELQSLMRISYAVF